MLFVSHASQDRQAIDTLLTALRRTGQRVWLDDELAGGEAWWQTILENIRGCQVFVVALSNNSLASKPCQAELRYAQAVRRPVLPVCIGPVDSVRVTPLAATQILDYRSPTADTNTRLISALRNSQAQTIPLPSQLPEDPEVPFAYLTRLASALSNPELGHCEQAELVSELRNKLDEDCSDASAHRDIIRLLYLLRDRRDVTWRTRTDVDALLAVTETNLSTRADGLTTIPFTGPQPIVTAPVSGTQPIRTVTRPNSPSVLFADRAQPVAVAATGSGPMAVSAGRTRRMHTRWLLAGGVGTAVIATIVTAALFNHPEPDQPDLELLHDTDLDTIMGVSGMKSAESGINKAKHTRGVIEVLPPDCAGVLYPGLDRTYRGTGGGQPTWKVSENRGGLGRAGVDGNHFVDQDVTVFPSDTDRALAFVRGSALQWKACARQTVTVTYRSADTFTWNVGDPIGDAPKIAQSFALAGGNGYGCQRVLSTVSDKVIDVKACGAHIGDEASRIADKLVASVTNNPPF